MRRLAVLLGMCTLAVPAVAWAHATLSIGNPERAKPLVERFDEIWATGEPGVSSSVLGL